MSNYMSNTTTKAIAAFYLRQSIKTAMFMLKDFWIESLPLLFRNSSLKGAKSGINAIVLANGPSLKTIDPNKIQALKQSKQFDVFAVNSYVSSEFGKTAIPNMYVLSDPAHFGYGTADGNKKREAECLQDVKRLGQIENLTLFVPFSLKNRIETTARVIPFCDRELLLFKNFSDIRFPRSYCSMTAYKALQIASYLGYDSIHLAGFDNDYFKTIENDNKNQLWEVDKHFYEIGGTRRKVCRPAYHCDNLAEYLISNAMLFSDLYGFKNSRIKNLISESLIDAFPKDTSLDVYL